ncbi:MAG: aldo/keto reductase [Phycisphaeraceae bacterium]|nr:aldo/keto reductase [Phycisphaeraceae bacterium]
MIAQAATTTVMLNNGIRIPQLGFGTFKIPDDQAAEAVRQALEIGYRHIDTAHIYANERGVGEGVRGSGLERDEVFVATKIWNDDLRAGRTAQAIDEALERLDVGYIDLLLIHWPVPGKFVDAWPHFEKALEAKKVRAIGVSNFLEEHLEELLAVARVTPAVNQLELHPRLQIPELRAVCENHGIVAEAWSPIMRGQVNEIEVLQRIAREHGKTPAQVTLRWQLQLGIITIPKTGRPERMLENADIFDFRLSDEQMREIAALDRQERTGPDPSDFSF